MLIFLHIPKTGGSTLTPVVDWNYKNNTYKISLHRKIQTFIDLPDSEKQAIEALQGQVFYGIHQYIPQDCQYITIMRDPIRRVVSQYFYENVRKKKLGEPLTNQSIEAFLEHEPFQAYTQINVIAGGNTIDEALKSPLTDNTFERAKANIETHFPVVGLIEKYDESVLLMKQSLDWPRAFYKRANTNAGRARFEDLPKDSQAYVRKACEPEYELYNYVQKRLQAQLDEQDSQFWDDLKQLKRANARFRRLHELAAPIRGTKIWYTTKRLLRRLQGD